MSKVTLYGILASFWFACACSLSAAPLFKTDFSSEAELNGWTKENQASVSEISRRPGARSLLIKQYRDEEQNSHWLSPDIQNPGGPVKISFWAADNYRRLTDFSYAATVDVVDFDKEGKKINESSYLKSMPWDQGRKSDLWGQLMPEGLTWTYYETIYTPKGDTFRVKFHWPKPIVLGECYLTDLMVTKATAEDIAEAAVGVTKEAEADGSRFALELSTPVLGNLFYADDPLEFEALLFTTDTKEIGALESATIRYRITDFEHFFISEGEVAFDKGVPVADERFYKSVHGQTRKHNLRQTLAINDPAASMVGRELFIRADLLREGKILASDTITYGVMDPRAIDPEDYDKSRFSSDFFSEGFAYTKSNHEKQAVAVKSGVSRKHLIDYYWNRAQPNYPGPITFKTKLPDFPPVISCPNLEQMRSSDAWLKKMVPPECLIPDPTRPGRLTFKIDPYVDYIVAYVRHNRSAIIGVVPSGLERPIDSRTLELHKKAYKALKKEWPELPVGMMLYGLSMNPSADVDLFIREELYDYADFIDTHIYAASVDWTEWHRLQEAYRKTGRTPPPLLSTEFSRVGGSDQVLRSRGMIAAHLDAFANGMDHIYYFNQSNEGQDLLLRHPFLREPTDLGGNQTSGFMYLQRVDRPRVSPNIEPANPNARWQWGAWGHEYGGDTLMPVLQAMTYYNLIQNFELSEYRTTFQPSPNSTAYVFDREDRTVCALWLTKPKPVETMVVRGDTPYTVQDLFGRTERIVPVGGVSLISVDENPVTLTFDTKVTLFDAASRQQDIEGVEGGLTLNAVARGGKGTARVVVPRVFPGGFNAMLTGTVDGGWPNTRPVSVRVEPGKTASAELPFNLALEREKGSYPFTVRMSVEEKVVGLLRTPLKIEELLMLDVTGTPLTASRGPEIQVTITSLRDQPSRGILRLTSRFHAEGLRAEPRSIPYEVPANGSTTVSFDIPSGQANLTTSYEVTVDLQDHSGIAITRTEEIGFRGTPRVTGDITIDGDLADWDLSNHQAIPFARTFTQWGKPWGGPADLSGVFYTAWDDEHLYFAAVIKDDSAVARANDINIWMDDNIMVGLYPWGWKRGDNLNSGYYREHLGLCGDGVPRIFRVGNVAVGPGTAEGARIAVTRTEDGYIYEWAYPKESIAPMNLQEGARFRLSLFAWDTDKDSQGTNGYSKLGGMQFGGFNASIDARPDKWREFVLVDEQAGNHNLKEKP